MLATPSQVGLMTAAVAEVAGERMDCFQQRRADKDADCFSLMAPDLCLRSHLLSAVFLVVLHLGQQSVVAWAGGSVPGMVRNFDQNAAYNAAYDWIESLGYADAESKCILLERQRDEAVSRAVIYYDVDLRPAAGAELIRIDSILGEPLGELAVASLAQVQKMKGAIKINPIAVDGWQTGRVSGTAAHQVTEAQETTTPELDAFNQAVANQNCNAMKLNTMLEESSKVVAEWAQSLSLLSTEEVPAALRKPLAELEWSGLRLPDPHEHVETE